MNASKTIGQGFCFVLKENHNFNDATSTVSWTPVQNDIIFHHEENDNHFRATNIVRVEKYIHEGKHIDS